MDTRKTTLIITIALIALVSVGIGFAYVAYTSNGGNNTDVAYITVSQDDGSGHDKYTFTDANTKVYFDTFTNQNDTYFKLNAQKAVTTAKAGFPEYTFVDLGAVRLVPEFKGTGNAPTPLYISIIASDNFDGNDNWVYFLTNKYSVNDQKKTTDIKIYAYTNNDDSDWINGPDQLTIAAGNNNEYAKPEIHLCYGYPTAIANIDFDDEVEELMGYLRVAHDPDDLQDASIVIKASEVDPQMKNTRVVTYCSDNTVNALKYIALVEDGTNYTFVDNDATLFDAPLGKVFGGWTDNQGQDIPATKEITADMTVYAKWVAPTP